jgi:hypothetical protein
VTPPQMGHRGTATNSILFSIIDADSNHLLQTIIQFPRIAQDHCQKQP